MNNDKKKTLLKFWFHYYGKAIYTIAEFDSFAQLLDSNLTDVENIAVLAYLHKDSPTLVLSAMRQECTTKLINSVNQTFNTLNSEELACFDEFKKEFWSIVIRDYNHPTPSIPLDPLEFDKQIIEIMNSNDKQKNK